MASPTIKTLQPISKLESVAISLASSKSESNRVLIINALAGGASDTLKNLSTARDTQTMLRLLAEEGEVWDVLDAGTTMRFLTSFAAVKNLRKELTGTSRMQQRPIGVLVDALRSLGAEVNYLNEEGYPPMQVMGMPDQATESLEVRGDISSQYISSLLMIAPHLPQGLTLRLTGHIGSRPYIQMTIELMKRFGARVNWVNDYTLYVEAVPYSSGSYTVESDWSGASYWFSLVALADEAELTLLGLRENSLQGDQAIVNIMRGLGVVTSYQPNGLKLSKGLAQQEITVDFSDCPDLGQTVVVACAAKGVKGTFTGLESLRIKETDRIAALQNELAKIGASFTEPTPGRWVLEPSAQLPALVRIHTYEDHRMAMAFAPLATRMVVELEDPDVVQKSYPEYWQHLEMVGIR